MRFLTRRLVMPNDLNYAFSLFGGRLLQWIDEEAAIYAICQLETNCLVTKHIGEISYLQIQCLDSCARYLVSDDHSVPVCIRAFLIITSVTSASLVLQHLRLLPLNLS